MPEDFKHLLWIFSGDVGCIAGFKQIRKDTDDKSRATIVNYLTVVTGMKK